MNKYKPFSIYVVIYKYNSTSFFQGIITLTESSKNYYYYSDFICERDVNIAVPESSISLKGTTTSSFY